MTNRKELSAGCLIMPGIYPGALIEVGSEFIGTRNRDGSYNGARFKVRKCLYSGNTRGGDWTIAIEGRPERP